MRKKILAAIAVFALLVQAMLPVSVADMGRVSLTAEKPVPAVVVP